MVTDVKSRNIASKSVIFEMRRSGMTMREIAEKISRSKERVRQILVQNCGKTDHELLSTLQLCILSGLPRNRVMDLYLDGIIIPAAKWDAVLAIIFYGLRKRFKKSSLTIKIIGSAKSVISLCLKTGYISALTPAGVNGINTNI